MSKLTTAICAAIFIATAATAQLAEPSAGAWYAVQLARLSDRAPDDSSALVAFRAGEDRVWRIQGPIDGRDDAQEIAALSNGADVEEHFTATLAATPGAVIDDAPADAPAYYRLWRLKFQDGAEARGADIVADRFVAAMESIGREVIMLTAKDAEWDALVFQGPFETADEAEPQYDVELEEALVDRINDPRIVMALKAELGALTAVEDEQVVYRWVADEPAGE